MFQNSVLILAVLSLTSVGQCLQAAFNVSTSSCFALAGHSPGDVLIRKKVYIHKTWEFKPELRS